MEAGVWKVTLMAHACGNHLRAKPSLFPLVLSLKRFENFSPLLDMCVDEILFLRY
jgi:hypothetical protein